MDFQNGFPAVYVRTIHQNLPIESSRAQKGGIEDLRAVGGGHDDHPFVRFEPVHLNQELLRVCSRSSLPPKTFIPLAFPKASSSSMKMIQGAWPVAWEKRSNWGSAAFREFSKLQCRRNQLRGSIDETQEHSQKTYCVPRIDPAYEWDVMLGLINVVLNVIHPVLAFWWDISFV